MVDGMFWVAQFLLPDLLDLNKFGGASHSCGRISDCATSGSMDSAIA